MIHRKRYHRASLQHSVQRRGAATVEFALVLPVLIALTVGTIDVCTAMFLKESAVLAAYEGARQGVGRGNTNQDVIDRVQEFLDERNIEYTGDAIAISSPGFDSAETLENVTVTVNIPAAGNTLMPSEVIGNLVMSASVTMLKEYKNLSAE